MLVYLSNIRLDMFYLGWIISTIVLLLCALRHVLSSHPSLSAYEPRHHAVHLYLLHTPFDASKARRWWIQLDHLENTNASLPWCEEVHPVSQYLIFCTDKTRTVSWWCGRRSGQEVWRNKREIPGVDPSWHWGGALYFFNDSRHSPHQNDQLCHVNGPLEGHMCWAWGENQDILDGNDLSHPYTGGEGAFTQWV